MPWIARREVVEPDGFADVTVRAQFVGAQDVGVGGRGGQDDHRDAAQVLVGVDRGEHFSAVGAGQVQVEQDEVRSRCGGVPAVAVQERQRGLAVTHDVHPVVGAIRSQSWTSGGAPPSASLHPRPSRGRWVFQTRRVAQADPGASVPSAICADPVALCSVVWVSAGFQPDQVGVDVVMFDLRSDRNDGQGVMQELLEVQAIGEQQGVRVGG